MKEPMQFGHFDDQAKEYVVDRPDTPRPWSNYLGSTEYGAIITNHAGGFSFYRSAALHRILRMRGNSVPLDQPGRYFYLRDRDSGDYWSSSWQPVGKPLDVYSSQCRHGTGYTIITSSYSGISTESTYFVPLGQTFEYWRLVVKNDGATPRRLSVFTYCEFANVGHLLNDLTNLQYSLFVSKAESRAGMLAFASHPHQPFDPSDLRSAHRYWMNVSGAKVVAFETLRERFIGNYGSYAQPEAVVRGSLTNFETAGENMIGSAAGRSRARAGRVPGADRHARPRHAGVAWCGGGRAVRQLGKLSARARARQGVVAFAAWTRPG